MREVGIVPVVRCGSRMARRAEYSLRNDRFADVTHQRESTCSTHPALIMNHPDLTPSRRRRWVATTADAVQGQSRRLRLAVKRLNRRRSQYDVLGTVDSCLTDVCRLANWTAPFL